MWNKCKMIVGNLRPKRKEVPLGFCCSSGMGMPGSNGLALVHRLRSLAFVFFLFFIYFPTYLDVHFFD